MADAPASLPPDDPLQRLPAAARSAHASFLATGDPAAADAVVLAAIQRFTPRDRSATPPADSARLTADLGYDSLAVAELVFFLEDIYGVSLANDDVRRLATVGDVRRFLREQLLARTLR